MRETWEEFVRADELRQAMQAGEILHGFVEGEVGDDRGRLGRAPSYFCVRG